MRLLLVLSFLGLGISSYSQMRPIPNLPAISPEEVDHLWASGNGGNHLIVIPEENMVITTTSGGYGNWYPYLRAYFILGKVINALD